MVGGGSYPSAEVQSVYSTASADWAKEGLEIRERIKTIQRRVLLKSTRILSRVI